MSLDTNTDHSNSIDHSSSVDHAHTDDAAVNNATTVADDTSQTIAAGGIDDTVTTADASGFSTLVDSGATANVANANVNSAGNTAAVAQPEPPATFTSIEPQIPDDVAPNFAPDATPEEAAAAVINLEQSGNTSPQAAVDAFNQLLGDHAGDVQWTQDFFAALGTEQTADLIDQSFTVGSNAYLSSTADAEARNDVIQDALVGLHEAGALTSGDMDALMNQWSGAADMVDRSGFEKFFGAGTTPMNSGIALAFAELPEGATDLKNLFFDSAQQLAGDTSVEMTDPQRGALAASGAYVLASTDRGNQVGQLLEVQAQQGSEAVSSFIETAMSGPATAVTLESGVGSGFGISSSDTFQFVPFDGAATLVNSATNLGTMEQLDDAPVMVPTGFSEEQLSALRTDVFHGAVEGLDANAGTWNENTQLKDDLTSIYVRDFDTLWQGGLSQNGARLDDDAAISSSLPKFFENVVFTQPAGDLHESAVNFTANTFEAWTSDLTNLDESAVQEKYGLSGEQLSHLMGDMLGHVTNGMEDAIAGARGRRAAQQAALETGINIALAALPGGGIIQNTLGKTGVDVLDRVIKKIDGDVRKQLEGATRAQAAEILLEELPDLNPSEFLADLAQELSEVIDPAVLDNFLSSYNNVNAQSNN